MTDEWDGTERRVADKRLAVADQRLAVAIAEVRDLREAAAKLAEAVQVRTNEFRRVVQQVAMMLAAVLVIIIIFEMWQESRVNQRIDQGHDLITCLLLIDPASRTAQTLIDCQR